VSSWPQQLRKDPPLYASELYPSIPVSVVHVLLNMHCMLSSPPSPPTLSLPPSLAQLIYRQFRLTQVSIKENKAVYTPASKVSGCPAGGCG